MLLSGAPRLTTWGVALSLSVHLHESRVNGVSLENRNPILASPNHGVYGEAGTSWQVGDASQAERVACRTATAVANGPES